MTITATASKTNRDFLIASGNGERREISLATTPNRSTRHGRRGRKYPGTTVEARKTRGTLIRADPATVARPMAGRYRNAIQQPATNNAIHATEKPAPIPCHHPAAKAFTSK